MIDHGLISWSYYLFVVTIIIYTSLVNSHASSLLE